MWPLAVGMDGGKYCCTARVVRPGHVVKKLFLMACKKVDVVGLKQAECKNWM